MAQTALFVSGLLAARWLGPADRGHLAVLALLPIVICQVGMLGVANAVPVFVARNPHASRAVLRQIRVPTIAQLAFCLTAHLAVLLILSREDSVYRGIGPLATVLVTACVFVQQFGLGFLQGMQRFRELNLLRLLPALSYSLSLAPIAMLDNATLSSMAVAWTLSNVAATAISAAVSWTLIRRQTERAHAIDRRELYSFALRGFLGSASPLETFRLDQAVVGLFLTPVAMGLYVSSLAFTNLPRFVAQSFAQVTLPYVAAAPSKARARIWMWRAAAANFLTTLLVTAPLLLAAGYIVPALYGDDFTGAVTPTRILLLSSVCFSTRRALGEGLRGRGDPVSNSYAEIASWIWLLPALALLAPRYGIAGVAWALVTSSLVSVLVLLARAVAFDRRDEASSAA